MNSEDAPHHHSVMKEPKFCRCRLCHEHFYAESVREAQQACREHARTQHPEWRETVCFCPD